MLAEWPDCASQPEVITTSRHLKRPYDDAQQTKQIRSGTSRTGSNHSRIQSTAMLLMLRSTDANVWRNKEHRIGLVSLSFTHDFDEWMCWSSPCRTGMGSLHFVCCRSQSVCVRFVKNGNSNHKIIIKIEEKRVRREKEGTHVQTFMEWKDETNKNRE